MVHKPPTFTAEPMSLMKPSEFLARASPGVIAVRLQDMLVTLLLDWRGRQLWRGGDPLTAWRRAHGVLAAWRGSVVLAKSGGIGIGGLGSAGHGARAPDGAEGPLRRLWASMLQSAVKPVNFPKTTPSLCPFPTKS